jgi:hypothetical protein
MKEYQLAISNRRQAIVERQIGDKLQPIVIQEMSIESGIIKKNSRLFPAKKQNSR